MSQVKAFTVGNATYNAAMASAVHQDELLSMLTAPLMERALTAAQIGKELSDDILGPMFMAMSHPSKVKIAEIILNQVFISGTQIPVTINDFSGRMVQYNQLLAQLLRFNLSDFFDWLPSALIAEPQPQPTLESVVQ